MRKWPDLVVCWKTPHHTAYNMKNIYAVVASSKSFKKNIISQKNGPIPNICVCHYWFYWNPRGGGDSFITCVGSNILHAACCRIHVLWPTRFLFPKQLPYCSLENKIQHASCCIQTRVIILRHELVVYYSASQNILPYEVSSSPSKRKRGCLYLATCLGRRPHHIFESNVNNPTSQYNAFVCMSLLNCASRNPALSHIFYFLCGSSLPVGNQLLCWLWPSRKPVFMGRGRQTVDFV